MGLREYWRKRDFSLTPEPRGQEVTAASADAEERTFILQKHAASHLHYDLRLELEGVLKSWSVPKGPSLDPEVKRLAMHTEDHPLEYGDFEGIIPRGQYGGGTVLLWDRGTWVPLEDPHRGYHAGKLKFVLRGEKLRGGFTLVRTRGRDDDEGRRWLLIKENDAEARATEEYSVVEARPESVASGRQLDEIAAARDRVWRSNRAEEEHRTAQAAAGGRGEESEGASVAGVRLSHPDRVLYPAQGITKRELALYYESVADRMVPLVKDRPLTLVRCPEGAVSGCVFVKHARVRGTSALRRVTIQEKTKAGEYLVADSAEALVSLAQMGILEIHTWNSTTSRLETPDRAVFDLDPDPSVAWERVIAAALLLRERLAELGLESFVKTTGGKGFHIVVPLAPSSGWDECLAFTKALAGDIARRDPKGFTIAVSKAQRKGKIFIDYLRNTRGATSVAAYSTRARPGAPVSAPLSWEELGPEMRSDRFTLRNLPERLAALPADPWAGYGEVRQKITAAMRRALGMQAQARR
ncbi:non-homologous end-joining DNA ligase [Sorangium sp. So ce590]|uniref:non-homologous end-joining DNA ligase n=1 Tax=unclassified Sorangium TaxID=2621164 RepID=UPI003F645A5E